MKGVVGEKFERFKWLHLFFIGCMHAWLQQVGMISLDRKRGRNFPSRVSAEEFQWTVEELVRIINLWCLGHRDQKMPLERILFLWILRLTNNCFIFRVQNLSFIDYWIMFHFDYQITLLYFPIERLVFAEHRIIFFHKASVLHDLVMTLRWKWL